MTSQGVLVIEPAYGAPDGMRAWLVSIPVRGEAVLMAAYSADTEHRMRAENDTELGVCLASFEGPAFKGLITHCVVLSNLGLFEASAVVERVNARWPHVICCTASRKATDGNTHEWPVAFAQRAIVHQEAATAVLVASRK